MVLQRQHLFFVSAVDNPKLVNDDRFVSLHILVELTIKGKKLLWWVKSDLIVTILRMQKLQDFFCITEKYFPYKISMLRALSILINAPLPWQVRPRSLSDIREQIISKAFTRTFPPKILFSLILEEKKYILTFFLDLEPTNTESTIYNNRTYPRM